MNLILARVVLVDLLTKLKSLFFHQTDDLQRETRHVTTFDNAESPFLSEILYELTIENGSNNVENHDSPIFVTIFGKEKRTEKKAVRYARNSSFPFSPKKIDRFVFVDRDVGPVWIIL